MRGLYIRVSSAEQASDGHGLDVQRKALFERAERDGVQYTIYEDAGVSGETLDRPAMQRMLVDVTLGKLSEVMAHMQDRFSRNTADWLAFCAICQKANVKVATLALTYDLDNPADELMATMLAAFARFDNAVRKIRSIAAKKVATSIGKYIGARAPFGYYIDGRTLKETKVEADVVRRIFGLAAKGHTASGIRDIFNSEHVPTMAMMRGMPKWATSNSKKREKAEWWVGPISHILRDRTYVGEGRWAGIPLKVPSIVTVAQFEAVQKIRRQRNGLTDKKAKQIYPLLGVVWCDKCGKRLHGESIVNKAGSKAGHAKTTIHRYYSHRIDPTGKSHKRHSWRADTIEQAVFAEAARIMADPNAVARYAQEQAALTMRDELMLELDKVNADIANVPAAKSRLADTYAEGVISKEQMRTKNIELEARLRQLESKRDSLLAQIGRQPASDSEASDAARVLAKYSGMIVLHSTTHSGPAVDPVLALRALVQTMPISDLRALIQKVSVGGTSKTPALRFEGLVPTIVRKQKSLITR